MYEWTEWEDHVTQYEDRYRESQNADGSITHTPEEGEIIQEGVPQNADNFNHTEEGVVNAGELAALLSVEMIHQRQITKDLQGDTMTVTLTNTQQYPFNNSQQTVALATPRNNLDYTVTYEIVSETGGFAGDVIISAKLVNGFKVEFTGSATSVTVKLYIKGGFYNG
jgi:hypothetical protein